MKARILLATAALCLLAMGAQAQSMYNKSLRSTGSSSSGAFGKDFVIGQTGYYMMVSGHFGQTTSGPVLLKMDFAGNIRRQEKMTISPQVANVGLSSDGLQWTNDQHLLISETWQRLIKVDTFGIVQWGREVDGVTTSDYRIEAMAQKPDGKIALGLYRNSSANDPRVMLCDANGQTLWYKNYAFGMPVGKVNDLDVTPDGGFLVTGSSGVMVKLDATGQVVWGLKVEFPAGTNLQNTIIEPDGSSTTICTGFLTGGAFEHIHLFRTDPFGNVQWTRAYIGPRNIRGFDLAKTSDGGYILAGAADDNVTMLIKTDASGAPAWNRFGATKGMKEVKRIHNSPKGGYAAIGWGLDGGVFQGVFIKTDANGFSDCVDQSLSLTYEPNVSPTISFPVATASNLSDIMVPVTIDQPNLLVVANDNCPTVVTKPDPAEPIGGNSFVIYPNPGTGIFAIEGNWPDDQATRYALVDIQGRVVWEMEAEGMSHRIPQSAPGAGIYLMRAEHGDRVVMRRVVVR